MTARIASTLLLLALPCLAATASAQTLRDEASGVAITAPPGYAATALPPRQAASRPVFELKTPTDKDTGCRVAVAEAAARNARMSQAEINAQAGTQAFRDTVVGTLSGLYEVLAVEPVTHGGITGVAAIGDIRMREGIPPRAAEIRSLLLILETPRLRITLGCVGERTEFPERLAGFEAVMRGLRIP